MGIGKRLPNGKKIVELRERNGLKQNALARDARISERLLRDIERRNKPVPATTITAIATALKVPPQDITLETPDTTPDASGSQQLKLRAVRSAYELSRMAEEAHRYQWDLMVDPTAATAKETQQLLRIIRRLVERFSVTDEFDNENPTGPSAQAPDDFGYITRLARLQESLDTLRAGGVGVVAGSYCHMLVTRAEDESPGPGPKLRVSGLPICGSEQMMLHIAGVLEILFVPGDVDEYEISVDTGMSTEQITGKSDEQLQEEFEESLKLERDK
jgi:transcriptional regulator with XRE-family HTH domain